MDITPYNQNGLYTILDYTDLEHGMIQVMTPVELEKIGDFVVSKNVSERKQRFFSFLNVNFHGQILPNLQFEIPADNVQDAMDKWLDTATEFVKKTVADLESQLTQQMLMGKQEPLGKPRINNGQPLPKPR